jgi:hypothetical protein
VPSDVSGPKGPPPHQGSGAVPPRCDDQLFFRRSQPRSDDESDLLVLLKALRAEVADLRAEVADLLAEQKRAGVVIRRVDRRDVALAKEVHDLHGKLRRVQQFAGALRKMPIAGENEETTPTC